MASWRNSASKHPFRYVPCLGMRVRQVQGFSTMRKEVILMVEMFIIFAAVLCGVTVPGGRAGW